MSAEFDGKVLVVTGAGGGIGSAIARLAVERGGRVLVADLDGAAAEEVASELGEAGRVHVVDVTDPDACVAMVGAAVAAFGRLDAAVNAHGVSPSVYAPVGEASLDEWRRVLAINLDGTFYCMRAQIPELLRSGAGSIVNFASQAGLVAHPQVANYVASKHAVIGLTKAAALEYATENLRVNAVAPGTIVTQMTVRHVQSEAFKSTQPNKRAGDPVEAAEVALFLASDRSSFVTGSVYSVDGAYTAQ